ncbi:MAG: hypothetical protein [Microviridae sp.]|nr:MAG: hypothetical protein [Microviridae sp.]
MDKNNTIEFPKDRDKKKEDTYQQRLKRFNEDWEKEEAHLNINGLPEEVQTGLNQLLREIKASNERLITPKKILTPFEERFIKGFRYNSGNISIKPEELNQYSAITLRIRYNPDIRCMDEIIEFHHHEGLRLTLLRCLSEAEVIKKPDINRNKILPIKCRPTSEIVVHHKEAKVYLEEIKPITALKIFNLPKIDNARYIHQMTFNDSTIFIIPKDGIKTN